MANSNPSDSLLRTPLYDLIIQEKAKMTEFSGWEMPVQFSGLKVEHKAVRNHLGMFDISHMGKFLLEGKDILPSLQSLVPSDLGELVPGKAQYTVLLNPDGGIIDDIIIYSQGAEKAIIIVNAGTKEKDKNWIISHIDVNQINFSDLSEDRVLLAVQGPQTLEKLQPLIETDVSNLSFFGHLETQILGYPAFVARTGYTGEDGFEIMITPEGGKELWRSLIEVGVTPCGLGARDTLRLEAAMCLYGQDIDEQTTPLEAGLKWLVHLEKKGEFIGGEVLKKQAQQGVKRRLVGLEMEGRYIARHGYSVISEGKIVGEVTSGTLSPTLGKAIALAYVPRELSKRGTKLEIEIRGKLHSAKVVKKPFYKSKNR
ncbi:MAG: glycine cleavage system aminomethyltransferase GcvT [Crocosphaera sp.]